MTIFGKKFPRIPPRACDLCGDKIAAYQPYYTVLMKGHGAQHIGEEEMKVLCVPCYIAYKDCLLFKETEIRHKKIKESVK